MGGSILLGVQVSARQFFHHISHKLRYQPIPETGNRSMCGLTPAGEGPLARRRFPLVQYPLSVQALSAREPRSGNWKRACQPRAFLASSVSCDQRADRVASHDGQDYTALGLMGRIALLRVPDFDFRVSRFLGDLFSSFFFPSLSKDFCKLRQPWNCIRFSSILMSRWASCLTIGETVSVVISRFVALLWTEWQTSSGFMRRAIQELVDGQHPRLVSILFINVFDGAFSGRDLAPNYTILISGKENCTGEHVGILGIWFRAFLLGHFMKSLMDNQCIEHRLIFLTLSFFLL